MKKYNTLSVEMAANRLGKIVYTRVKFFLDGFNSREAFDKIQGICNLNVCHSPESDELINPAEFIKMMDSLGYYARLEMVCGAYFETQVRPMSSRLTRKDDSAEV